MNEIKTKKLEFEFHEQRKKPGKFQKKFHYQQNNQRKKTRSATHTLFIDSYSMEIVREEPQKKKQKPKLQYLVTHTHRCVCVCVCLSHSGTNKFNFKE